MAEPTDEVTERHGDGPDRDSGAPPGMPRWVKVSLLVLGALILVFIVLQLAGVGGRHGPGRHGGALPPVDAVAHDAVTADRVA